MSNRVFLIGHYDVEGFGPDSVETPVIGRPKDEYRALETAIRERHPKAAIKKQGSHVEQRELHDPGFIEVMPGTTLRGLFPEGPGSESDQARKIGRVSYQGKLCEIIIRHARAAGVAKITLKDYTGSQIPFNDQIQLTRAIEDLPKIVAEVLGAEGRDVKLRLRKKIQPTNIPQQNAPLRKTEIADAQVRRLGRPPKSQANTPGTGQSDKAV